MIQFFKNVLGFGPQTDFAQLVKDGAIIIDVRSKGEYSVGHILNALNIPVDTLKNNLNQLKDKNKPIITCCASGVRSGVAKKLLTSNGYAHVLNGGNWYRLQQKINN